MLYCVLFKVSITMHNVMDNDEMFLNIVCVILSFSESNFGLFICKFLLRNNWLVNVLK